MIHFHEYPSGPDCGTLSPALMLRRLVKIWFGKVDGLVTIGRERKWLEVTPWWRLRLASQFQKNNQGFHEWNQQYL